MKRKYLSKNIGESTSTVDLKLKKPEKVITCTFANHIIRVVAYKAFGKIRFGDLFTDGIAGFRIETLTGHYFLEFCVCIDKPIPSNFKNRVVQNPVLHASYLEQKKPFCNVPRVDYRRSKCLYIRLTNRRAPEPFASERITFQLINCHKPQGHSIFDPGVFRYKKEEVEFLPKPDPNKFKLLEMISEVDHTFRGIKPYLKQLYKGVNIRYDGVIIFHKIGAQFSIGDYEKLLLFSHSCMKSFHLNFLRICNPKVRLGDRNVKRLHAFIQQALKESDIQLKSFSKKLESIGSDFLAEMNDSSSDFLKNGVFYLILRKIIEKKSFVEIIVVN